MNFQILPPDPFAEQESEKYGKPVPSRLHIMASLAQLGKPSDLKTLIQAFQLEDAEEEEGLRRRLLAMVRDNQLYKNRRGLYGLIAKLGTVIGTVRAQKDGFGRLRVDETGEEYFLPPKAMQGLCHGDRVLAHVVPTERQAQAQVIKRLSRALQGLIGQLRLVKHQWFIKPWTRSFVHDVVVENPQGLDLKDGDVAIARLGSLDLTEDLVEVVRVLGAQRTANLEVEMALYLHQIPHEWTEEVLSSIKAPNPEPAGLTRKDLRHLPFVTIDGADAKDFDDAVLAERHTDGWTLWVAIADVSQYVPAHSPLDEAARSRATSVYFPSCVIPMLPELLSDDWCSLKPHVERQALVCEVQLTLQGRMKHYEFYPALISSRARLIYEDVAQQLAQQTQGPLWPQLQALHQLYLVLKEQREKRGAIDLDLPEIKPQLDEEGRLSKVEKRQRNIAHQIIEECMLLANVAAGQFCQQHAAPVLYRVHEPPNAEKHQELVASLKARGIKWNVRGKATPLQYAKLLKQLQTRPDKDILQMLVLRSLPQAVYQPENKGHFGLGYDVYTHFTSPIRRYADLWLHRQIYAILQKQPVPKLATGEFSAPLAQLGEVCSSTERRADEATREVMGWLQCQYMKDRVGESFTGVVTSVTGFGLFVQISEVMVDGLLHVTALDDDYYHFDKSENALIGERSKRRFGLGDIVTVQVDEVHWVERKIDLSLVNNHEK